MLFPFLASVGILIFSTLSKSLNSTLISNFKSLVKLSIDSVTSLSLPIIPLIPPITFLISYAPSILTIATYLFFK